MRFAVLLIPILAACIAACDQRSSSLSDRQSIVERCLSQVSQKLFEQAALCLQPFEQDGKPDRQTAVAVYQLGKLYESGQGVPADPDHAVRLYKLAGGLGGVAPEIAEQASVAATKLINKMRQAEEP